MNIIKIARKPYLAVVFASVMLFASCSQYDHEINESVEPLSVTKYVEKHIELTSELINIVNTDKELVIEALSNVINNTRIDEIEMIFENANFNESKSISKLIKEIQDNTFHFVESNPEMKTNGQDYIVNLISHEIEEQKSNYATEMRQGSCDDKYGSDIDICKENYYFSLAVIAVTAVVSFGIATISLANCMDRAFHTYDDCLNYQP